jgi:hypothetical protein
MRIQATIVNRPLSILISSGLLLGAASAQSPAAETAEKDIALMRSYIDRWVAASQDVAKTRTNWQFEKDILLATKESLEGEVAQVKAQIEDAKKEETTVDETSKELAKEQVELSNAAEAVTAVVEKLEARLVGLIPQLPSYLQRDLGADLELLNNKEKREKSGIATRVTTITNVLIAAEKANSDIISVNEEREVNGKTQSVRTVYLGLATAYSSTEDGSVGWIGTPSASGWTFEERPEEADAISKVVAIANDEADVSFVPVTAKISD